jgi:hypothetical protein
MLKRVFRYLVRTQDAVLRYDGSDRDDAIYAYTDSDWAGDPVDCRSVSGFVFKLCNGAVSWSSKKQPTVALSTTESEYMAAAWAAREAIWIRSLLTDLNLPPLDPTSLYCDNTGAVAMGLNPKFHGRTKHIGVRHHFIRERVESGEINFLNIRTHDNAADLFTKGLPQSKHDGFCGDVGLVMHSQ